jgi:hypothetical protein
LGAFCPQTKCKNNVFKETSFESKIHVLSRVDRTIGFKTWLSVFVLGDSKLELAFLLVSCLLDNVFFMNNNKNKNLIICSIIIIINPKMLSLFPKKKHGQIALITALMKSSPLASST